MSYDGFISYSHLADGRFAIALQRGLQRFARPWNVRRALRIFRDDTGLATNPHLWSSIASALDESEWFVLLASPEATQSEWVQKEIAYWVATKPLERLLLVVTDGSWEWDRAAGDFTADSTAVPAVLRRVLREEPRHLDVRWARDDAHLDLQHSRFRSAVADLAAPMHGIPKDELEGEDLRQYRKTRRLARGGVVTLAVLLVVALMTTGLALVLRDRANDQRDRADGEARLSDARRLATIAVTGARDDLARSALLGIEANRLVNNAETRGALLSLAERAAPIRRIVHGTWNAVAVTPDGQTAATVGPHGISLVDLRTGATRSLSHRNFGDVGSAGFSPDGRLLALGGTDVEILDAQTGTPARAPLQFSAPTTPARTRVKSVRFSPDGTSIVALASNSAGLVWSLASGAELAELGFVQITGGRSDVAFSPDGRWLAVSGNGGVAVDAHTFAPRYRAPPQATYHDRESDVAFSADGSRFAVATDGVGQANRPGIVVRDATNGAVVGPTILMDSGSISLLAYSPDGRDIAGALSDGTVLEWDAGSGAVRHDALLGPTRSPIALSFTPAGELVVATSADIVVFDPGTQLARRIAKPNGFAYVNSLAESPDGRSIASADGLGFVRVWDSSSGHLRSTIAAASPFGAGAATIAYRPGTGAVVVGAGDGMVSVWDPRSEQRLHPPIKLTESNVEADFVILGRGVQAAAFDSRGKTLVAAGADGRVAVIDPDSWTVRRTLPLVDDALLYVQTLAISSDGETLALGGTSAVIFSSLDGTHQRRLPIGPVAVTSLAFAPGGRLVAAALQDGRVLVIDPTTLHVRFTLVSNHGGTGAVAFNASGTTLATGGSDGTVTLWSLKNGQPLGPPLTSSQNQTVVGALAFSSARDDLYSGGGDGSLVRYQLRPSRWIERLCSVVGRNLTVAERRAYLTDHQAGRRTCPNWPATPTDGARG